MLLKATCFYTQVLSILKELPKDAEPMAVLRSAVSLLSHYDPDAETTLFHRRSSYRPPCRLSGRVGGLS